MILWLDHWIFGNGFGLRSPYYDDIFYWLKDAYTDKSELYTFWPGFGAQLHSIQWYKPKRFETRMICGRELCAVNWKTAWGRVYISWGLSGGGADLEEIRAFGKSLGGA